MRWKARISALLAAVMLGGLLPAPAGAAPSEQADAPAIKKLMLSTTGIESPKTYEETVNYTRPPQSYIYFGVNDAYDEKRPIKWRVLDAEKASDNEDKKGMFLLSEYALAPMQLGFGWTNQWEDSTVKEWCAAYVNHESYQNFTAEESGAMLITSKNEAELERFGSSVRREDKAFFLSVPELNKYVARTRGDAWKAKQYHSAGEVVSWWLLTRYGQGNSVTFVGDDGVELPVPPQDENLWARPAMNLNSDQVVFTTPAAGMGGELGKLSAIENYPADADGAREWRVALKDESRNFNLITQEPGILQGSSGSISYSGAKTGENEYISAILMQDGQPLYYSKLKRSDVANSAARLSIPEDIPVGDYTLYVFNERDDGANKTVLVNDFRDKGIRLQVTENPKPKLTNGSVQRHGERDMEVTFTSDKEGTFYYLLAEEGAPEPTVSDIKAQNGDHTCKVGTNVIWSSGLHVKTAKKIYIVATAFGMDSDILKLDIPPYAPYTLTVRLEGGDGSDKSGNYQENDRISLTAGKKEGYTFVRWESTNGGTFADATAAQTMFTMPAGDTTVTAVWAQSAPSSPSGSSGSSGSSSAPASYQNTAAPAENGTVTLRPARASRGATVTVTAAADEGYRLASLRVTDANGGEIALTERGGGVWTFVQPGGAVTVRAAFEEIPWVNPFTDVAEGDWFYEGAKYAHKNGIITGVGGARFAPNDASTRAMFWAVLARLRGETVEGAGWVEQARSWAVSAGVSDGTQPEDGLTREQLVTMLYRFSGEPDTTGNIGVFADSERVSPYARTPMAWAVETGIVSGVTADTLAPQSGATRAQLATLLARLADRLPAAN